MTNTKTYGIISVHALCKKSCLDLIKEDKDNYKKQDKYSQFLDILDFLEKTIKEMTDGIHFEIVLEYEKSFLKSYVKAYNDKDISPMLFNNYIICGLDYDTLKKLIRTENVKKEFD